MDFMKEAMQIQNELVQTQHYLHGNAEVGFALDNTVRFVTGKLKEYGYEPQVIGDHGVIATLGPAGKNLLLRADMDALPITEDTGLPYASKNGCMHACGHDFHTAILLGVAKLLKQNEKDLRGTVKLFFQPAEELLTGCKNIIDAGLLKNPEVTAAVALHTAAGKKGQSDILVTHGVTCASCDNYKITIKGRGSHGASPENSVDPIVVGCHIVLSLQNIVARETGAQSPIVQTICKFAGGSMVNSIPDSAELLGTLRTLGDKVREKAKKRLEEIVSMVAQTFGATATLEWLAAVPTLTNNEELVGAISGYLGEIDGLKVEESNKSSMGMGSEDFALITEQVPGVYIQLVCVGDENGHHPNSHGPHIVYDDERLYLGVAALAKITMSWLRDNNPE